MSATAQQCYDAMLRLGVGIAEAHFSGGNDEGGYDDNVIFTMLDEDAAVPSKLGAFDSYNEAGRTRWDTVQRQYIPIPDADADEDKIAIASHLNAVLAGEYGGFGGDYSVFGNVIVNAQARTTRIAGEESGYSHFERVL